MNKQRTFRRITERELYVVNQDILKKFGSSKQITSGSCGINADGKRVYHITMADVCSYKPFVELQKIGSEFKKIFGANEVYYLGMKIA